MAIQTSYTQLQSSSESELGITEYPGVKFFPEATRRLLQDKASTWLLVRVYHSDDSIKRVTKHFKEYAQKAAKDGFAGDAVTGPLEKSLLRDNWRLKQSLIRYAATIFGVGTELMASAPEEKVETSFGIILLSDSFVRVHLISPHPSPSDNNKLSSGTMIVLIRERREGVGNADNENHADEEKVYTGREVTRRGSR